jgi:hypothetical protein
MFPVSLTVLRRHSAGAPPRAVSRTHVIVAQCAASQTAKRAKSGAAIATPAGTFFLPTAIR